MIIETVNDITLTPAVYNIIKQMVGFQPKHFTKLPYGHVGLKELCKLFPEHKSIYIRAKIETLFWLKFEKDEVNEFDLLVNKIVEIKKVNMDLPLIKIIHERI